MSGSATFDVTYSKNSLNLFGASGPKASDVNQGDLGDCYLLAPLAEVAMQDPSIIEQMITNNGNGTFGVRFYVDGVARYVTVDDTLPDGGTAFNSSKGGDWASLIEKAYAELPAAAVFAGEASYSNSFSGIGNGGDPSYTLLAITGASKITEFSPDGSKWLEYALNSSEGWTGTEYASNAAALSKIAADIAVGDDVILSSYTNATDASGKDTLIADHALSVYGYDASTGMLEIRNPWGTRVLAILGHDLRSQPQHAARRRRLYLRRQHGDGDDDCGGVVVAAAGLQSLGKAKSFSVTNSVSHVGAALTTLASETKLTSVAANGNGAGATLNLSGFGVATTVNLGVNSDQATITGSGASESIALGSPNAYGSATLGTGADKVVYTLGAGVQDITNFSAAHDVLSVNLNGGTVTQSLIGGSDWVSSASSNTQGVLLARHDAADRQHQRRRRDPRLKAHASADITNSEPPSSAPRFARPPPSPHLAVGDVARQVFQAAIGSQICPAARKIGKRLADSPGDLSASPLPSGEIQHAHDDLVASSDFDSTEQSRDCAVSIEICGSTGLSGRAEIGAGPLMDEGGIAETEMHRCRPR